MVNVNIFKDMLESSNQPLNLASPAAAIGELVMKGREEDRTGGPEYCLGCITEIALLPQREGKNTLYVYYVEWSEKDSDDFDKAIVGNHKISLYRSNYLFYKQENKLF